jgi:Ca2+-binding EF-hand superfamily protein
MRYPTARLILCLTAAAMAAGCSASNAGGGSSVATPSGQKISELDKSFLRGISSYDLNRDGVITCDEWRTSAASAFIKANKSGSGVMTEEEFRNLAATDRTFLVATSKYYDANGDGKVDKKEFIERPNAAFAIADQDKDCRLTDVERLTARNLFAPTAEIKRPNIVGTEAPSSGTSPGRGGGGGY